MNHLTHKVTPQTAHASSKFSRRKSHALIWATLGAMHSPLYATADLVLKLDSHFGHNNNLFRNARQEQLTSSQRSQNIEAAVGIPLGSEVTRLVLTASLGNSDFTSSAGVDHNPSAFTAELPWRLTDLLGGSFSAGKSRTAYSFDDSYPRLDMVDRKWSQFALKFQASPSVSIPIELAQQSVEHQDQLNHGRLDSKKTKGSGALMYQSQIGSTAKLGIVRIDTRYPKDVPSGEAGARQELDKDVFIEGLWAFSPQTQASAWWANRKRTATLNRDQTRVNLYRLGVSHTFSPWVRVNAQLWRQPVADTENIFANGQSSGQRVGLAYTPNHKWEVSGSLLKETQQNQLSNELFGSGPLNQSTVNFALRTRYNVTRGLFVYADAATEKRTRPQNQHTTQKVFKLGVEYLFENLPNAGLRTRPAAPPSF